MPQFPLYAFVAVLLALLGAAFTGHLPPADLVRDVLLLALPGAGAVLRSLRPASATAAAEVRILRGGQLLDLVALAQRLLAAEHPAVKEAGAQLGELLSLQPARPQLPAGTELGLLEQLGALSLRWANQPSKQAQAEELLAILDKHMDRAEAALPAALRPPAIPPIALFLLLPLLALAPSCASWPAWRSALAGCGVQIAPAGVEAGVALALRGGDGWTAALAGLASTYGDCLVKAQVLRHAQGEGPEPPRSQAVAAPLEGLIGGELTASSSQVSKAEAERRAAAWLRGHR